MTRDRGTRETLMPGDVYPSGAPDPAADALARVYALILSWPLPEEDERALRQEEETE